MTEINKNIYLSAKAAAAELGVSLPTLYAYVSRGMIRSEPEPGTRSRRYRADDIRNLRARQNGSSERGAAPASALSWGEPVMESAITLVTATGPHYRGVSALELAENATFEEVALLLWDAIDEDPFQVCGPVPGPLQLLLHHMENFSPVDRMAACLAAAEGEDPTAFSITKKGQLVIAARIIQIAAAALTGEIKGLHPLHRTLANKWLNGDAAAAEVLRYALVLLADHELNVSTFTARCIASAGASLYQVAAGGLAALRGSRHGGAAVRSAVMVRDIMSSNPLERVRERARLGEAFPGFGHPLYPQGDPRAKALLGVMGQAKFEAVLVRDVPAAIHEATGEHPTIDYALAVLAHTLDLPPDQTLSLFAIARLAGWLAHGMEQAANGQLIRPRARYTGLDPK